MCGFEIVTLVRITSNSRPLYLPRWNRAAWTLARCSASWKFCLETPTNESVWPSRCWPIRSPTANAEPPRAKNSAMSAIAAVGLSESRLRIIVTPFGSERAALRATARRDDDLVRRDMRVVRRELDVHELERLVGVAVVRRLRRRVVDGVLELRGRVFRALGDTHVREPAPRFGSAHTILLL